MRILLVAVALAASPMPAAAPAQAQQPPSADCRDDRGVDRCSAEQQRRVLDLFGMKPIEEHQRAGDQVRRAFFVDGYGRDLVAISFIRSAGSDPMLHVHWPRRPGQPAREPARLLVPAAQWQEVLRESRYFDRSLQPLAPVRPDTATICLHSWVYTVEATDPAAGQAGPAPIRRKVEDACDEGLAAPFASELAARALAAIPYCAAIDPDLHRNPASILHACGMLEGDRLAAVEAYNRALRLARSDSPEQSAGIVQAFHWRGTLDWNGEVAAGGNGNAAKAWTARMAGKDAPNFYITRVIGETARRVRVEGTLSRTVRQPGQEERNERAPVTLLFESDSNAPGLRVERATVGAFEPAQG